MTPSPGERRLAGLVDDHMGRTSAGERQLRALAEEHAARAASRDDGSAALDPGRPVYVISVAAELAGMHAQTLRQYDRLGLVTPERTGGGGRRYSMRDIEQLRQVQELSADGVSLAGIQRIMELENQVTALSERVSELVEENASYRDALDRRSKARVFHAGRDGIVALKPGERPRGARTGSSLVLYSPRG